MVGGNPAMQDVFASICRFAPHAKAVLSEASSPISP
jgi:hypothetical protein